MPTSTLRQQRKMISRKSILPGTLGTLPNTPPIVTGEKQLTNVRHLFPTLKCLQLHSHSLIYPSTYMTRKWTHLRCTKLCHMVLFLRKICPTLQYMYLRDLYKTSTIVFTVISTTKQAKFHLSRHYY